MTSAQRIAEILIPEGNDRKGRETTIPTIYGRKTREGIADLIERETGASKLLAALEKLLSTLNQIRKNGDDYCFNWRNEPLDPCNCAICEARAAIAEGKGQP